MGMVAPWVRMRKERPGLNVYKKVRGRPCFVGLKLLGWRSWKRNFSTISSEILGALNRLEDLFDLRGDYLKDMAREEKTHGKKRNKNQKYLA
jgi:hypothetical protein